MIFISKRTAGNQPSSGKEACISFLGLLLAGGLLGGLAGLIYGLIKGSVSATISGGIVFGISIILTVIFIFLIVCCLKTNNANLNTNLQHHQQQQNGHMRHTNSSQEITTISAIQKYEQTNGLNTQIYSTTVPVELTDSKTYSFSRSLPLSPLKTTNFDSLNQSNSSTNSYDSRQNYYNRH